jgi:transcriptional regulator with XRE-family HTH domain
MRDKSSETLTAKLVAELAKLRKEHGISHEKLAEKTGLSRATISYTESGKSMPTILTCVRIAKALGVRLSDVLSKFDK